MKVTMVMFRLLTEKLLREQSKCLLLVIKEDKKQFFSLIKKNNLIVMGRATYEASKPVIKLEKGKLRIVLTRSPNKYSNQSVKDQLEFSDESPNKLLKRLLALNYGNILLVGGSTTNGLFLKQNLVDKLYLTIEPKIFGSGKNLVDGQLLNTKLHLISVKKINKAGTLLLKYKIIR